MGIRGKTLTGFLILSTMLLLAGAWSIYELTSIGTSVQKLLDDNYRSVDAARQMTEALEREDSAVLLLLSGKWREGRSIMAAADSAFQDAFMIAQMNVTVPGEQQAIDEIAARYDAYRRLWERPIVDTVRQGNLDWYFQEAHQSFLDVRAAAARLMSLNDRAMYRMASTLEQRARRAVMPGVVAIIAALVFSLLFNYFVDKFLVRPLIAITEGLRAYVDEQRAFDVSVRTTDELGDLAAAVRSVLGRGRA
jgi:methyl-accepting chemotaxis protein